MGAADAMSESLAAAIKETMERLANARKLREAAVQMGMGEAGS